jgi:hypothetical protein
MRHVLFIRVHLKPEVTIKEPHGPVVPFVTRPGLGCTEDTGGLIRDHIVELDVIPVCAATGPPTGVLSSRPVHGGLGLFLCTHVVGTFAGVMDQQDSTLMFIRDVSVPTDLHGGLGVVVLVNRIGVHQGVDNDQIIRGHHEEAIKH